MAAFVLAARLGDVPPGKLLIVNLNGQPAPAVEVAVQPLRSSASA